MLDFRAATDQIASNQTLVELTIYNCHMTYDNLVALCNALIHHRNTTLKSLVLTGDFSGRGLTPLTTLLQTNKSITLVKFIERNQYQPTDWVAMERFCDAIRHVNYTVTTLLIANVRADYIKMADPICARNQQLQWPKVHAMILDAVITLAPLQLPAYILLWIFDWLPWIERAHVELKKIRLIESVIGSIRRVKRFH
jgi:hypothetical protein